MGSGSGSGALMLLARSWLCCALGLWLSTHAPPARAAQSAGGRVVVVGVGSNQGLDTEYPLRFAVQDAERFGQVMTELGNVQPEDLHLLANPSKAELLQELSRVRAQASADETLVVYFSGHGSTLAVHLAGEKLNLSELYAAMNAVPAQGRLLLVDACRGEARKGFQSDAQPFEVGMGTQGEGLVAIHSTGLGEISVESNELRAGVFSHLFVSGLRGPADTNHDHAISVSEAYDYAKAHRADWGSPAPEMEAASANTTRMTLTRVNAPHSLLVLPAGNERYMIYAAGRASELVRAWASHDAATRVALPGDHFIVHKGNGASREVAEVVIPFGGIRTLEAADFRPQPEGQVKGWFQDDGEGGSLPAHELGIAGGTRLSADRGLGPALTLGYAYGMSGWAPAISLSLSQLRTGNGVNWVEHTDAAVSLGLRHATFFDSFSAVLGAAATLSLAQQSLISEATDSGGQRRTNDTTAVGYGGSLNAGVRLPLLGWLSTDVGLRGTLLGFREKTANGAARTVTLDSSMLLELGFSAGL
ncbi:MAG: hypothetical protein RL685_817 [Pseudomonadota bacterium]|jgi:hypothetical protein